MLCKINYIYVISKNKLLSAGSAFASDLGKRSLKLFLFYLVPALGFSSVTTQHSIWFIFLSPFLPLQSVFWCCFGVTGALIKSTILISNTAHWLLLLPLPSLRANGAAVGLTWGDLNCLLLFLSLLLNLSTRGWNPVPDCTLLPALVRSHLGLGGSPHLR